MVPSSWVSSSSGYIAHLQHVLQPHSAPLQWDSTSPWLTGKTRGRVGFCIISGHPVVCNVIFIITSQATKHLEDRMPAPQDPAYSHNESFPSGYNVFSGLRATPLSVHPFCKVISTEDQLSLSSDGLVSQGRNRGERGRKCFCLFPFL